MKIIKNFFKEAAEEFRQEWKAVTGIGAFVMLSCVATYIVYHM